MDFDGTRQRDLFFITEPGYYSHNSNNAPIPYSSLLNTSKPFKTDKLPTYEQFLRQKSFEDTVNQVD